MFIIINLGLKKYSTQLNTNSRYKLFTTCILFLFWQYFKTKSNCLDMDTFKIIVNDLDHQEIDKIVPFDLLEKFQIALCKKNTPTDSISIDQFQR